MSTPKMRQFKQMLISMELYGSNSFCDGKKVEFSHGRGKNKQTKHNNHKQPFKTAVTNNDAKILQLTYAIGGGRWGPNFEYSLGKRCLNLRDPKHPNTPNKAMIHFMIPRDITNKVKFHDTQYFGELKNDKDSWKKQDPMSFKSPFAISNIEKNGKLNELMLHINNATPANVPNLSWRELLAHPCFNIKQVSSFRFFNHHQSFSMSLTKKKRRGIRPNTCIMKTNDNRAFKFTNVYRFRYNDNSDILLAYGQLFPIHASETSHNWINDKFKSMDYIDFNERRNTWYFCTNFIEPIFLIHKCVDFDSIRHTLPRNWRHKNSQAFYHNYPFNMHKLMQEKDEFHSPNVRHGIQLPCGPIFKCKAHNKSRCRQCPSNNHVYDPQRWKLKWKCNKKKSSRYYVFDRKNGLNMTLMKTLQESHDFVYYS